MGIFDAIVVYCACGSPFAVYRIAIADVVSSRVIAKSAVYLFLWPVTALRFLIWHLPRITLKRGSSVIALRNALEAASFGHTTHERRLRFRDVFDRYAAYQAALPGVAAGQILQIAGHPDLPLARACLERRSQRMIDGERSLSRHALITITRAEARMDEATFELLVSLAEHFDDHELRDHVEKFAPAGSPRIKQTSDAAAWPITKPLR